MRKHVCLIWTGVIAAWAAAFLAGCARNETMPKLPPEGKTPAPSASLPHSRVTARTPG